MTQPTKAELKDIKQEAGIIEIHGKDYQTVARRIQTFHTERPEWRIITKVLQNDLDLVLVRARIQNQRGELVASGHAEEHRAMGQINKTSALENAETSAIGRALAVLGYGGTEIRSADEMLNAINQQSASETIAAYFVEMLADETDACFEMTKGERGQDQVICHDEKELASIMDRINRIQGDDHELKHRYWRKLPSLVRSYISDMEKG